MDLNREWDQHRNRLPPRGTFHHQNVRKSFIDNNSSPVILLTDRQTKAKEYNLLGGVISYKIMECKHDGKKIKRTFSRLPAYMHLSLR